MITLLQHGSGEQAGRILPLLDQWDVTCTVLHLYEGETVPIEQVEELIVLGGLMSVNDEQEYPFLAAEKNLIRTMIKEGRPVLGICLGAQMIAAALGYRVFDMTPEQGWYRVRRTPGGDAWFPAEVPVFEWHHQTFELPDGATLLYQGEGTCPQGFIYRSALGVQFHPEATIPIIDHWTAGLSPAERDTIIQQSMQRENQSNLLCSTLLAWFHTRRSISTGSTPF
ncbi:type 1 glutamine amidotransferase [Methanosphaerula palustris]|uniref:Glutamine amidotransferase class-I n=1 Tax=Methanosphaerula palustris (strain ATCC BAA-1556 / DSM 19958 / E1-9c) TaxID=521011 RepID=B8GJQ3_METPE|nr:type 1 glutamine amidotransferase [Methanosphaerula palustris]ACL15707.1 glutamine amidotransferase class-I [Methanosphaerula palustris E1-9c]